MKLNHIEDTDMFEEYQRRAEIPMEEGGRHDDRRKSDKPTHPYRKHGTPLNKPPSDPNYPQKPFNYDEWMNSTKKNEEAEQPQQWEVGQKALSQIGGRWIPCVITKPPHPETGNYGIKIKIKDRVMNYVASPEQLKPTVKEGGIGGGSLGRGLNRWDTKNPVSYEDVLDETDPRQGGSTSGADNPINKGIDKVIGWISEDDTATDPQDGPIQDDYTEESYKARLATMLEADDDFKKILKKQHKEKQKPVVKQQVKDIPFHGWTIRYRPPSQEGEKVPWMVISKKGETKGKGEADSEKDAVRAGEDFVKQGGGTNQTANKNVTIDFNSKFVQQFFPGAETFYSTVVEQNGQPHLILSNEPHGGLQKSSIRAGTNFPSISMSPRSSNAVKLQPHGRYILDLSGKEELDDPGITMYPLVFQSITQDKSDRAHLSGPGLTVATPRGMDEAIDPWHGYTPDDPKFASASRRGASLKGSPEVPLSELISDTIRTHGVKWAFNYYVKERNLPPRQFRILAADALNNP